MTNQGKEMTTCAPVNKIISAIAEELGDTLSGTPASPLLMHNPTGTEEIWELSDRYLNEGEHKEGKTSWHK